MSTAASRHADESFWAHLASAVRKSVVLEGRARRTEAAIYYIGSLVLGLIAVVLLMVAQSLLGIVSHATNDGGQITMILISLPLPALLVRRGHDVGVPTWLTLAVLVVMSAFGVAIREHALTESAFAALQTLLLIGCFVPARSAAERFGPDPRQP